MSNPAQASTNSSIRLLLIDDSDIFLSAIQRFLSRDSRFLTLAAVQHPDEAIALPREPAPQVILLDVLLGDQFGIRHIAPLKEKWPQAKIVVLTFSAVEQYRDWALGAGADAFVSKLYVASDLIPAIERVLQP